MIIPNLMITDMPRSIAFYRDLLGMNVTMMISAERKMLASTQERNAVFATLEWQESQLMLQTVASLSSELSQFSPDATPYPSGTIYFRTMHPDTVLDRVANEQIVKGPLQQWYGMREIYLRDPDGYIICLGAPEGSLST